ncbi:MAG: tRNA dihydrouridine synthase DusB [Candidatus Omnitrophica bacterium]|nr:tRNA dihydrouridine synthase DusB [Candidatus Omnitrophota bacterium]
MNIGKINIAQPLALAPMENVTDFPFRFMCQSLGADLLYTEFTSAQAIIRDAAKAWAKAAIRDAERPIGIQIFGRSIDAMAEAARRLEVLKPDFIDINAGCWARDVVRHGEGAGLLLDLVHFENLVKAVVRATSVPVTVKTRLGWDPDRINILTVAPMLEQAGAQALTVHCRTRDQGYQGAADWTWLEKIRQTIRIPLIGNGDVKTGADAKKLFDLGCDGVMIGRGVLHNPWIFSQTREYLRTGKILPEPDIREKINACKQHLQFSVEQRGPYYGVVTFRKYYAGYLKGIPNIAHLRQDLMCIENQDAVVERLERFASS